MNHFTNRLKQYHFVKSKKKTEFLKIFTADFFYKHTKLAIT